MFGKLMRLSKECINELDSISEIPTIHDYSISFEINYKAKKRLGQCVNEGLNYRTINISSWLLEHFSDKDIKNTIMHELLHCYKECKGHDYMWQKYAGICNKKLGYHITRLANVKEMCNNNGINAEEYIEMKGYKYEITCKKCGKVMHVHKMSEWTKKCYKEHNCTHRSCGGKDFKVIDLKLNKVICND